MIQRKLDYWSWKQKRKNQQITSPESSIVIGLFSASTSDSDNLVFIGS